MFIGPPAEAIDAMGSKTRAREMMQEAGVPIVPGTTEPVDSVEDAAQDHRRDDRLPGGDQGRRRRRRQGLPRRRVRGPSSRRRSRAPRARARSSSATRPSTSSATCPTRATSRCRCWPTRTATSIHLGERDCSVQRRHQKLIEESPAPAVDEELRERIGKIGIEAARAVGYRSAGTIEGLLAGRRVLLPRDEHARAGRALRDRDGHRHRHRARADPDRRGRAAVASRRRTSRCAATRSSAASTPRTPRRTSPPPRARSPPTASRRARRARGLRRRGGLRGHCRSTTR